MKRKKRGIRKALGKSAINYFSDLFILSAVIFWWATVILMVVVALYLPERADLGIWAYIVELVVLPLAGGVVTWMLKNAFVHKAAEERGEVAKPDFPDEPDEMHEGAVG